jgi:hypothetical protein
MLNLKITKKNILQKKKIILRGRLHSAFSMCVFMIDKPIVAEACPPMLHASASSGLSDIETHILNAPCNRPLHTHTKKMKNEKNGKKNGKKNYRKNF